MRMSTAGVIQKFKSFNLSANGTTNTASYRINYFGNKILLSSSSSRILLLDKETFDIVEQYFMWNSAYGRLIGDYIYSCNAISSNSIFNIIKFNLNEVMNQYSKGNLSSFRKDYSNTFTEYSISPTQTATTISRTSGAPTTVSYQPTFSNIDVSKVIYEKYQIKPYSNVITY